MGMGSCWQTSIKNYLGNQQKNLARLMVIRRSFQRAGALLSNTLRFKFRQFHPKKSTPLWAQRLSRPAAGLPAAANQRHV